MSESWGFETKQVHAGAVPDPTTGARAVPIYQTTSYVFRDTEHAADLFALAGARQHLHADHEPDAGRVRGPHRRARRRRRRARRSASGPGRGDDRAPQPRPRTATTSCRRASLYGGTYNLFHYTLPEARHRGHVRRRPRRPRRVAQPRSARTPRRSTARRIGNPKGDVFDFEGVSEVAHENGIPLVIDNTVATPYLCRPIEWGADIVVHSATKFIGGHGTSIGGVIVDGGTFDYGRSGRFPNFTEPDPSYHGLVFSQLPEPLRPGALHPQGARCSTCATSAPPISPFNAFLFLQGLETLSLRMERHCAERAGGRRVARGARRGRVGQVSRASRRARGTSAAQKYLPQRLRRDPGVRHQGRHRGRQALRRRARAAQPPRQRRRRAQPGHPPGHHDAQPAQRRTSRRRPACTPTSCASRVGIESLDDILADLEAGFRAAKGA